MNRGEQALGLGGVLATLLGVGLLVAPDRVNTGPVESLTARVAATEANTLMLGLAVAAVLLVAVAAWPRSTRDGVADRARPDDPDEDRLLGAAVETAVSGGGDPWGRLRERLVEAAVEAYARRAGVPVADADAAVRSGAWTDDRLAAGVTTGDHALRAQVRLWSAPERERRRRVERTVTAIERLDER